MARHIAKNIVAAELAERCEVQLAYAIGFPNPVSVRVDTMGTGKVPDVQISKAVKSVFDLRPAAIIKYLNLLRPIFECTSNYGHFGRTKQLDIFTWERTDKVKALLKAI